jgi:ribosome-associated heat shock protein Hsp15
MHGDRVKPARPLQVGDLLSIRLGPYEHVVRVRELSARRGPSPVAATLYEETAESLAARTRLAEQLRLSPAPLVYEEKGRPTKRDRREIDRWRRR